MIGVSTIELEALRELSRAAFRQDYRAELMIAISDAQDGIVCLTDLARALDVSISNLQAPLKNWSLSVCSLRFREATGAESSI